MCSDSSKLKNLKQKLFSYSNKTNIVRAVMSENGVRCFFRGKSNLKTFSESLRGDLSGIPCCQKLLS